MVEKGVRCTLWARVMAFLFSFFLFGSRVLVLRDDVMCSAHSIQLAASTFIFTWHLPWTRHRATAAVLLTPSTERTCTTITGTGRGSEGGLKELAFWNHVLSIAGSVEEIRLKTWNERCCFEMSVDFTYFLRRRRKDGNYKSISEWLAIVSSWILTSCKLLFLSDICYW